MMRIGILQFTMHVRGALSLKDKRAVVRSIKDKISRRFNVSIAEIDDLESHTHATMGMTMAGNDVRYIRGAFDKIVESLRYWPDAELEDHVVEILSPEDPE